MAGIGQGESRLMEAIKLDDLDLLSQILSETDDLDFETKKAFAHVVKEGLSHLVLVFISRFNSKSKLNLISEGQESFPLFIAIDNFDVPTIRSLTSETLTSEERSKIRKNGSSPLFRTARWYGDMDMTRALLQAGFDPNEVTMLGSTLLTEVCHNQSVGSDLVALLLDFGADVDQFDSNLEMTPISATVRRCKLKSESDVNHLDEVIGQFEDFYDFSSDNDMPEHYRIVRMLLDKGCNVNTKDGEGKTPLFEAVVQNNMWLVRNLLEKNADPNAPCKVYDESVVKPITHSPLTFACLFRKNKAKYKKRKEITKTILTSPLVDVKKNTDIALGSDNWWAILELMSIGLDGGLIDEAGSTLLHKAVQSPSLRGTQLVTMLTTLIEYPVDADIRSNDGDCALHVAIREGKDQAVMALSLYCDINACDGENKPPIVIAMETVHPNIDAIVDMLLQMGAITNMFREHYAEIDLNVPEMNENALKKIRLDLKTVKPLKELCRIQIRRSVRSPFYHNFQKLRKLSVLSRELLSYLQFIENVDRFFEDIYTSDECEDN